MFHTTRIKLTAWYLLIVMAITGLFSGIIYYGLTREMERGFERAQKRLETQQVFEEFFRLHGRGLWPPMNHMGEEGPRFFLFVSDLAEAKHKLLVRLVVINGVVWVLAAWASYVLAGKSLEPIAAAVEEQKRFISDAAHELRTPVAALRTALEVNLEDKKLARYARNLLKENLDDVKSLEKLVTGLLKLSKLSGTLNNQSVNIDLIQLIKQVVKILNPLAVKKKISIMTKFDSEKLTAKGNEDSLRELVTILLDNAVKYTHEKGKVWVSGRKKNRGVEIRVKDTGQGIAKKDLSHIFDRFYRVDDARCKEKVDGFGLGLALAKKIVEQHGGRIEVKSTPGKGSVFRVELPRV
jgi:signal transduction histidine kinase